MNKRNWILILTVVAVLAICRGTVQAADWEIDMETGMVNSGYNVVRSPGEGGTQVSLDQAFDITPQAYFRGKIYYHFNQRHSLGILAAPLRFEAQGEAPFAIHFEDQTFPAHTPLKAVYRFDSYRMTYRYRFWKAAGWTGHVGLTAKIRDAEISLEGNGEKAVKTNTGFVPLIYLRMTWNMAGPWTWILDADALAAPQGRAEDVLVALQYQADEHWNLRLGYRGVEGGADNKEVYTFAAIHYAVIGFTMMY